MNRAAPPNKKRPSTRPSNGGQTKINQTGENILPSCLVASFPNFEAVLAAQQTPRPANQMRQDTRGHFTSSAAHN